MNMLTPYDIAEYLQVSYETALEFIRQSNIPYIKVGRQYRVPEKAFNAYIEATAAATVNSDYRNIYNNCKSKGKIKIRRIS